jgi:hypothetical protein|tara:strand:- start:3687 stop:3884 length:198 start_codon:yes stop_codon:yes gene_type:complete
MDEIFIADSVFKIIRERRQNVSDILGGDNIRDMEHYKKLMGILDGLNYVEQELKSLLDKQERSID